MEKKETKHVRPRKEPVVKREVKKAARKVDTNGDWLHKPAEFAPPAQQPPKEQEPCPACSVPPSSEYVSYLESSVKSLQGYAEKFQVIMVSQREIIEGLLKT